jgi:transcriptional regulator with XRE-family HTH domain
MPYAADYIVQALKAARNEKGLTQRDLSKLAGVPQSHISKIENGAVNIQLSSLAALARALDLEVMPVSRKLVPAIQSIIRRGSPGPSAQTGKDGLALKYLASIKKRANQIKPTPKIAKYLLSLKQSAEELGRLKLGPNELAEIRDVSNRLQKISSTPGATQEYVQLSANELRVLRNKLTHAKGETIPAIKPAYTLEEDGDA